MNVPAADTFDFQVIRHQMLQNPKLACNSLLVVGIRVLFGTKNSKVLLLANIKCCCGPSLVWYYRSMHMYT